MSSAVSTNRLRILPKLLEDTTDIEYAFSTRRLAKSYTGNCMRVRRSTDNLEADVGFYRNQLDEVSLVDHVTSDILYKEYLVMHIDPAKSALQGSALLDLTGKGNNVYLQGGATVVNNAYILINGSPQYMSIDATNTANIPDNSRAYTTEFWWWDDNPALVGGNVNLPLFGRIFVFYTGQAFMSYKDTGGGFNGTTFENIVDSTWKHIVISWTGATATVYINGVAKATYSNVATNSTDNKPLAQTDFGGNYNGRYGTYRYGAMRVYLDKAFTAAEVLQQYDNTKWRYTVSTATGTAPVKDGYVVKWYSQIPGKPDMVQLDPLQQPRIVLGGSVQKDSLGKPLLVFGAESVTSIENPNLGSASLVSTNTFSLNGYELKQSSVYLSYDVTKAFNKIINSNEDIWHSTNLNQWIQIKYPAALTLVTYYLTNRYNTMLYSPSSWTVQGANDGTTFTTIDTRSNVTWSAAGQTQAFTVATPSVYTYFRLQISAATDSTGTIFTGANSVVAEWKLFGAPASKALPATLSAPSIASLGITSRSQIAQKTQKAALRLPAECAPSFLGTYYPSVPTPTLWMDLSELMALGHNSSIASWGGATGFAAGTGAMPVLDKVTESIPFVALRGTSSANGGYFDFGSLRSSLGNGFTYGARVRWNGAWVSNNYPRLFDFFNATTFRIQVYRQDTTLGVQIFNAGNAFIGGVGAGTIAQDTFQTFFVRLQNTGASSWKLSVWIDGTLTETTFTSSALVSTTFDSTYVGRANAVRTGIEGSGNAFANIDVQEMLWWNSSLSDAQIATAQSYISAKFASVTNLMATSVSEVVGLSRSSAGLLASYTLSTPKLWMDVQELMGKSHGSSVTTWNGATASAAGTAGYLPYIDKTTETLPFIALRGTSATDGSCFNYGSQTFNINTNGGFTFVGYVRMKQNNTYERLFDFSIGDSNANNNLIFARDGTSATGIRMDFYAGTTNNVHSVANIINNNVWQIYMCRLQNTGTNTWVFSIWNSAGTRTDRTVTATYADRTLTTCNVGRSNWPGTDVYSNMDIREMMWWDSALTDAQIAAARTYLTTKYSQTSLPYRLSGIQTAQAKAFQPATGNFLTTKATFGTPALLDLLSAATKASCQCAFSLRRLTRTYAGPVVRIRRASDNLENDFYGLETDATKIRDFLQNTTGYIKTWYDQSGKNNHATQTTNANQPRYTANAAWASRPAISFDGTDDHLPFNGAVIVNTPYSVMATVARTKSSGLYIGGSGGGTTNTILHLGWRADTTLTHAQFNNDYDMTVTGYGVPTIEVHAFRAGATGKNTYRNGLFLGNTTNTQYLASFQGASLGRYNFNSYYQGDLTESFVFSLYLSDAERSLLETSMVSRYLPTTYPPAALTGDSTTLSGQVYTVTSSTQYNTSSEARWRAFDRNPSTSWTIANPLYYYPNPSYPYNGTVSTLIDGTAYPGEWLQIQLPQPVQIASYFLGNNGGRSPKKFKLAASNDGVTWTAVDTQTGATNWTESVGLTEQFKFTISTTLPAYAYYRLAVSETWNQIWLSISEFALYGPTTTSVPRTLKISKATSLHSKRLLDKVSQTAACAFSVARKLRALYTGPACRVRNASGVEKDIFFDSKWNLDQSSLVAHCGTGDGFVTVLYDQSGNGRHAVQTTQANQPKIVVAGTVQKENNRVTMAFSSASSHHLRIADFAYNRTAIYAGVVVKAASNASTTQAFFAHFDPAINQRSWVMSTDVTTFNKLRYLVNELGTGATGNKIFDSNASFTTTLLLQSLAFASNTVTPYKNGALEPVTLQSANNTVNTLYDSTADLTIGCQLSSNAAQYPLSGTLSECFLFDSTVTGRATLDADITSYYTLA